MPSCDQINYKKRLFELLKANYEQLKVTGIRKRSDPKIEGFMEAGLCTGVVDQELLRGIINDAHLAVFDVPFAEKIRPKSPDSELLDIPTYIRDKF